MSRRLLCFLAICVVPLMAFSQEAFEGPRINPIENDHGPFRWLHRGELYHVTFGPTSREELFVYHLRGEKPIVVTGSLTSLSEMIRREISDIASLKKVVQDPLSHILLMMMGGEHNWFVLSQDSVRWFGFAETGAQGRALTQKLLEEEQVLFDDRGGWTLNFCVIPRDGSVQRWIARGTLSPFLISDLKKTAAEQAGTLPVVPFTGK